MSEQKQEIKVNFPEKLHGGVYANNMIVTHTKEEFVLDFLAVFPPQGMLNARVIISPGHLKRLIKALQENLGKYETRFGAIQEASSPEGGSPPQFQA